MHESEFEEALLEWPDDPHLDFDDPAAAIDQGDDVRAIAELLEVLGAP